MIAQLILWILATIMFVGGYFFRHRQGNEYSTINFISGGLAFWAAANVASIIQGMT